MEVLPALDLIEGKTVRLTRGNYRKAVTYEDMDPLARAAKFREAGAIWVHIVDLDGARTGAPANLETAAAIRKQTGMGVEFGGGIRSDAVLDQVLGAGIDRAILGTAAIGDPEFLDRAVKKWGDRLAVALDIRNGEVVVKGWRESGRLSDGEALSRFVKAGVKTVIVTDTDRDGMMEGADPAPLKRLMAQAAGKPMTFIAGGGISTLVDVKSFKALESSGCSAVIAGKAVYEGTLDLAAAFAISRAA